MNLTADQGLETLSQLVAPLEEEASRLETALNQVVTVRDQYRAAIKVLESPLAANKPAKTPKSRCVRKRDCITLAEGLLQDNGGTLQIDDLLQLITAKCNELGWSKSGLALRFKETCNEPQFDLSTPGQVRLQPVGNSGNTPTLQLSHSV